jgi:signal transduction histidine kinase
MQERVEAFNGDLMFQSEPGEGTVVSIHLPFVPEITYHQ